MSNLNIPQHVGAITTTWLGDALGPSFPERALTASKLLNHDSGTTGRARFALEWSGDGNTRAPRSIFIKLTPTDPLQVEFNQHMRMGQTEAQFYRDLVRDVPVNLPAGYYSDWSDDGRSYILIMEDLRAAGARDLRLRDDIDFDIAEQIIDNFAKLHGKYWNSGAFENELDWITPYTPVRSQNLQPLIERGCDIMAELYPPVIGHAKRFFQRYQNEICELYDSGTPTLVHADPHMSNLYLDGNGKVGFLDWATVSKMPAAWDIAYMCISFPPVVRRRIENELLSQYCVNLETNGGPNITREALHRDFRCFALWSWISAIGTLGAGERMQPLEWTIAASHWTSIALEELDVLTALKDALGVKNV